MVNRDNVYDLPAIYDIILLPFQGTVEESWRPVVPPAPKASEDLKLGKSYQYLSYGNIHYGVFALSLDLSSSDLGAGGQFQNLATSFVNSFFYAMFPHSNSTLPQCISIMANDLPRALQSSQCCLPVLHYTLTVYHMR